MASSRRRELDSTTKERLEDIVSYITTHSKKFAVRPSVDERDRNETVTDLRNDWGIPKSDTENLSTGQLGALERFLYALTPDTNKYTGVPRANVYMIKLKQAESVIEIRKEIEAGVDTTAPNSAQATVRRIFADPLRTPAEAASIRSRAERARSPTRTRSPSPPWRDDRTLDERLDEQIAKLYDMIADLEKLKHMSHY